MRNGRAAPKRSLVPSAYLYLMSFRLSRLPVVKCLSIETLSHSDHKAAELWLQLKLEKFTALKVGLVTRTAWSFS